jgi:hypothetical protein
MSPDAPMREEANALQRLPNVVFGGIGLCSNNCCTLITYKYTHRPVYAGARTLCRFIGAQSCSLSR